MYKLKSEIQVQRVYQQFDEDYLLILIDNLYMYKFVEDLV
jgi:hypothetical protein